MLQYRIGGTIETGRLSVKVAGDSKLSDPQGIVEGTISEWKRVAVLTETKEGSRCILIEPGTVEGAVRVGDLFVRGPFKVVRRVGASAEATQAWGEFVAE